MFKIAIVANNPPPYRVPIFKIIGQTPDVNMRAIFCCEREPNRLWDLPPLEFDHIFLREKFFTFNDRYIHNNLDVTSALRNFFPDVIVTDGFNPTHLYAFAYARLKKIAHIPFTDGTLISESTLSNLHRMVRRYVFSHSHAFVSASQGGQDLYESYGIAANRCFKSCLCIDNSKFFPSNSMENKRFDFIFCGRLEAAKNPLFAIEVAVQTAKKLSRKVKILFAGSGSEEENIKNISLKYSNWLDVKFHGFATQDELPALYQSAKIFLFPTLWDVWGVVANEACAAGLPVIASPYAGVAGELVQEGVNGFICELEACIWAEKATVLLSQPQLYAKFSKCSLNAVNDYTFEKAAFNLLAACRFAEEENKRSKNEHSHDKAHDTSYKIAPLISDHYSLRAANTGYKKKGAAKRRIN